MKSRFRRRRGRSPGHGGRIVPGNKRSGRAFGRTSVRKPSGVSIRSASYKMGYRSGLEDRLRYPSGSVTKKALNERWNSAVRRHGWHMRSWKSYVEAMKGYVRGYCRRNGKPSPDWVLLPTARQVAVVVTAMNEARTLGLLMHQLERLPVDELYVIVNGSQDASFQRARAHPEAVVVNQPDPLGHDVGRALGAKLAKADIVLFLDADMVIKAEQCVSFVGGIEAGLDVALNDIDPYLRRFDRQDDVTRMKQFLNLALGRPELGTASMTAVPHAISRTALDLLGPQALIVPPKAHALAVWHKLKVGKAGSVNVIKSNRVRRHNQGRRNKVADLIIGDHLEALSQLMRQSGERLGYPDWLRQRSAAGEESSCR